ncbi:MAG: ImmA/IrrE family metallo-endopeptidase [Clostridium sp.]
MTYDKLLKEYKGIVTVKERPLRYGLKGLYKDNKILINSNIETDCEKACVLAEELGHHFTSYGDIIDINDIKNVKQEIRARNWSYEKLVGVVDLITAYRKGVKSKYELAEFLDVPEWFLNEVIEHYKTKYGTYTIVDNYIIYFTPSFGVMEMF